MADEDATTAFPLSDWHGLEEPSYGSDGALDFAQLASVLIIGGVFLPILAWGAFLLLGGNLPSG